MPDWAATPARRSVFSHHSLPPSMMMSPFSSPDLISRSIVSSTGCEKWDMQDKISNIFFFYPREGLIVRSRQNGFYLAGDDKDDDRARLLDGLDELLDVGVPLELVVQLFFLRFLHRGLSKGGTQPSSQAKD